MHCAPANRCCARSYDYWLRAVPAHAHVPARLWERRHCGAMRPLQVSKHGPEASHALVVGSDVYAAYAGDGYPGRRVSMEFCGLQATVYPCTRKCAHVACLQADQRAASSTTNKHTNLRAYYHPAHLVCPLLPLNAVHVQCLELRTHNCNLCPQPGAFTHDQDRPLQPWWHSGQPNA